MMRQLAIDMCLHTGWARISQLWRSQAYVTPGDADSEELHQIRQPECMQTISHLRHCLAGHAVVIKDNTDILFRDVISLANEAIYSFQRSVTRGPLHSGLGVISLSSLQASVQRFVAVFSSQRVSKGFNPIF